jgi:hypothetical protein
MYITLHTKTMLPAKSMEVRVSHLIPSNFYPSPTSITISFLWYYVWDPMILTFYVADHFQWDLLKQGPLQFRLHNVTPIPFWFKM